MWKVIQEKIFQPEAKEKTWQKLLLDKKGTRRKQRRIGSIPPKGWTFFI
jgi:hypothetical protein